MLPFASIHSQIALVNVSKSHDSKQTSIKESISIWMQEDSMPSHGKEHYFSSETQIKCKGWDESFDCWPLREKPGLCSHALLCPFKLEIVITVITGPPQSRTAKTLKCSYWIALWSSSVNSYWRICKKKKKCHEIYCSFL